MRLLRAIRDFIYGKAGTVVRDVLPHGLPYQSFLYNAEYIPGRIDTVRMYYSFGISSDLKGRSWLDLGCNEGSICLLAAQDGANPVVGVEIDDATIEKARARQAESGITVEYVKADITEYVEEAAQFDVVSMLAMLRHVHKGLMISRGFQPAPTGRAHLVYDSYNVLIAGQNNPVKEPFDRFLGLCISRARRYFVCSMNDHSGLVLRRKERTAQYFRGLTDRRAQSVEVYSPCPQTPEYVVILMEFPES